MRVTTGAPPPMSFRRHDARYPTSSKAERYAAVKRAALAAGHSTPWAYQQAKPRTWSG